MVASDFGAGGFGEMGKLGWSDLWDGGQGRGSGLRASPGEQDEISGSGPMWCWW